MGAQCHACIGGTSVREDMRKLDDGVHVVVGIYLWPKVDEIAASPNCVFTSGTPGRVYDMISRKVLRTGEIKMFVLDEADEMLSRGFKDQIYDVFRHLNSSIQVQNYFPWAKMAVFRNGLLTWVRLFYFLPPCPPRCWRWRLDLCASRYASLSRRKSSPLRVSVSSMFLLKGRNGSSTLFATCTRL